MHNEPNSSQASEGIVDAMWQFRKDDHSKWYWKEVDDMGRLLRRSAELFIDRIDCIAHAMRNGYVHPRQRALAERSSPDPVRSRPRVR
jgi:hypothetical protein